MRKESQSETRRPALTARQYFHEDQEIRRLATLIYERMDYAWMCNGGMTLSHGWTPENGFINIRLTVTASWRAWFC
jgi:hypothetical protein